jgi:hypothetical protein
MILSIAKIMQYRWLMDEWKNDADMETHNKWGGGLPHPSAAASTTNITQMGGWLNLNLQSWTSD